MILHPCAVPRCGELLPPGVSTCKAHTRERERRRGSAHARGYTGAWQIRARLFRERYPLCGMRPNNRPPVMSRCHDEGRLVRAAQVDHVVPHRGDEGLFWDEANNWQSLCASCGAAKSRAGL